MRLVQFGRGSVVTDPQKLAAIIARNIATSDITLDEVAHIVRLYIRLFNRLSQKQTDAERFVTEVMEILSKKMEQ